MDKTYIAADARFWDEAAAQAQNLSVEDYNIMVVDSINKIVEETDTVILNGIISKGDIVQTSIPLEQIKCKKVIIDYRNQIRFTIAQWRAIGMTHIWDTAGAIDCVIMGKNAYIILGIDKEDIKKDRMAANHYVAAPGSLLDADKIYDNKTLNISLDKWNFEPIDIEDRLVTMIDDQELFLTMEDS